MSDFELDDPHDELQDAMSDPSYVAAADADYAETIRIQTAERLDRLRAELHSFAELEGTFVAAGEILRAPAGCKYSETYHAPLLTFGWRRFASREPIASMLAELSVDDAETVKAFYNCAYWLEIIQQAQIPLPLYPDQKAS